MAVEYSTRAVSLQERIWIQQAQWKGDAVSMLALFEARTNLTREEALALDPDGVREVWNGIADGISRSAALMKLQEQFD